MVIWTKRAFKFEHDPTKILLDNYTPEQIKAQEVLDGLSKNSVDAAGELLIIIPFRNHWDLTRACLVSLKAQKLPTNVSLKTILVDNRSDDPATITASENAAEEFRTLNIQLFKADFEFNFSRLNNKAFQTFVSEHTKWVLFLNNDIELRDDTIIPRMITQLETAPLVGVVGCSLLYPTGTIQHLFAAPGVKIIAAHPLKNTPYRSTFAWFSKPARPVAAVTGAVMMMRRKDFLDAGMFDENLPTLGQDVILCLAVNHRLNKFTVALTTGPVIHHESKTKKAIFPAAEIKYIYSHYDHWLQDSTWFSGKFSRWSEKPLEKFFPEARYPAIRVANFWQ